MEEKKTEERTFVTALNDADQFRLLFDVAKDYSIFMLDPAGNVVSWNIGAEKSSGYKAQEIVGQHFSCFYSGEDVEAGKPRRDLQIALKEGRFEERGRRIRKGGSPIWAVVTITAIDDASGQHIGFANVVRDVTEAKQFEDGLLLRHRAIESFLQGVCISDPAQPDNPIVYSNDSFLKLTGYAREEILGRNCRFLQGPKTTPESVEEIRSAIREKRSCLVELINYRKDGTPFWNALSISPIHDSDGQVSYFAAVQTDISSFKLLQQQFQQAQKMEALGQLAGGVAHDFNNLLTVISGYSEILLDMLPLNDPNREVVKAVSEAGEQAAGLTRQLLMVSRQSIIEPRVLDLNDLVNDSLKMLRRVIEEDVLLTAVLDPKLNRVKVDPGHVSQVLMNLAVNARDAMAQGGKLRIATSNVELDADYAARHLNLPPGRYVKLTVGDTGGGMTPEIKARVFEPFFTTKGAGKGTGLGLATVFGIVKQCGGGVQLDSELGIGSTFNIFIPAVVEPVQRSGRDKHAAIVTSGTETVLLVEDDDAVRVMTLLTLQAQGYTVLQASRGRRALEIVENHRGGIDLLVTDVVMPGMSGRELADALGPQLPGLKVLYLSGYTDDAVIRHGVVQGTVAFLQKPYTSRSLALKVREVLDQNLQQD